MASRGKFFSSYLIRCGEQMVGLKTLLVRTDSENATGEIIGFDISPTVEDYNKVIMVRGDSSLPCIVLPDVNIRVNVKAFFEGKFTGDKLTGKFFLKREGKATRAGKDVTIFSVERVSAGKRSELKPAEISSLKTALKLEGFRGHVFERNNKTKTAAPAPSTLKKTPVPVSSSKVLKEVPSTSKDITKASGGISATSTLKKTPVAKKRYPFKLQ
ncbi:uncharacterized protein LOC123321078 [Coccinella septempunctata]|uniref:uncharacterized protein LOC123321078 n=1 Tax=Coccinella septempunctata TaxID=41139 RepID=UPI001D05DF86|nr:uncharacterized protein LOC123321078 [Coccinella septempunctata]